MNSATATERNWEDDKKIILDNFKQLDEETQRNFSYMFSNFKPVWTIYMEFLANYGDDPERGLDLAVRLHKQGIERLIIEDD